MSAALISYRRLLESNPYKTKCITAFVIYGTGDLICQYLERVFGDEKKKFNLKRTFRQASFGFLFTPFGHLHFSYALPKLFPGTDKLSIVKSMIYDQTAFTIFFTTTFFLYMDIMAGKSVHQSMEEQRSKLLPTLYTNWAVWPALILFNLSYVPVPFRVLFTNVCGLFWNIYLSYVQNVKSKNKLPMSNML